MVTTMTGFILEVTKRLEEVARDRYDIAMDMDVDSVGTYFFLGKSDGLRCAQEIIKEVLKDMEYTGVLIGSVEEMKKLGVEVNVNGRISSKATI